MFTEVDAEWISAEIKESAILRDNIFGIANKIAFKGEEGSIINNSSLLSILNNQNLSPFFLLFVF